MVRFIAVVPTGTYRMKYVCQVTERGFLPTVNLIIATQLGALSKINAAHE